MEQAAAAVGTAPVGVDDQDDDEEQVQRQLRSASPTAGHSRWSAIPRRISIFTLPPASRAPYGRPYGQTLDPGTRLEGTATTGK